MMIGRVRRVHGSERRGLMVRRRPCLIVTRGDSTHARVDAPLERAAPSPIQEHAPVVTHTASDHRMRRIPVIR